MELSNSLITSSHVSNPIFSGILMCQIETIETVDRDRDRGRDRD